MEELDLSGSFPARSRLYSPAPMGLGTGLLESLASYLSRLAEAHWARVSDLMAYLTADTPDAPLIKDHRIFNLMRWRGRELNGMQQVAQRWSALVADQTRRSGMDQLTLLPWRHLITPRALIHLTQRWCPRCLEEWVHVGQPVYWPLLWSLRAVTVCPIHRISLECRCPQCEAAIPAVTACGQIGFCPKCCVWLGTTGRREARDQSASGRAQGTDLDIQTAHRALDLLAASAGMPEEPTLAKLNGLLAHILQARHCRRAALAERLHLSPLALYQLLEGRRHLSLPTLLQVLTGLGLEIGDFVQKPISTLVTSNDLNDWISGLPRFTTAIRRSRLNPGHRATPALLAEVQGVLETAVTQERPPGLPTLAHRCGLTTIKVLWLHYPDLCRAIVAKRKSRLNRDVIRHVLRESLMSEDTPPTIKTLAARLEIAPITLRRYCPDEVAALRAQRRAVRDPAALRGQMEAFLHADPPVSLSEVLRQIDIKLHHIEQYCPDLRQALVQRFVAYKHACAVERERQSIAAVREAVTQLCASGETPNKSKVAAMLGHRQRLFLTEIERDAFNAMLSELGLMH